MQAMVCSLREFHQEYVRSFARKTFTKLASISQYITSILPATSNYQFELSRTPELWRARQVIQGRLLRRTFQGPRAKLPSERLD